MTDRVAVCLPDGRWLLLGEEAFAAALEAGRAISPPGVVPVAGQAEPEPWLTSAQLSALTQVGDTTLEAWAKQGVIPCIRAGKALRFRHSEVLAALRPRHADMRSAPHGKVHESYGRKTARNQKTTSQIGARS